jgi:hypothetical protein
MSEHTNSMGKLKRKGTVANVSYKRNRSSSDLHYHNMILELLKKRQKTAISSREHIWMTLEVALDSIPLHLMMKKNNPETHTGLQHVPVISRAKEEEYMRECYKPEDQPCIMQENCECNFIDLEFPFTGVSFVGSDINITHTGLCILCLRKNTQMLFYRVVAGGFQSHSLMQVYGNYCGVLGEYHESVMLTVPPHGPVHCLPLPVVAHQRNRYKVIIIDGKKHLKQIDVAFEDFQ